MKKYLEDYKMQRTKAEGASFDWENFYSQNNASLIEGLLDKGREPIGNICNMLYTKKTSSYVSQNSLKFNRMGDIGYKQAIEGLKKFTENNSNDIKLDSEMLIENKGLIKLNHIQPGELSAKILSEEFSMYVGNALDGLVHEGLLPIEIYRLPRKPNEIKGLKLIPDYYEIYDKDLLKKDFFFNYPAEEPSYFTYEELLVRWKEYPKHNVYKFCKKNLLGAYIKPKTCYSFTFSYNFMHEIQSKTGFRKNHLRVLNCGNPLFTKRHDGFERLNSTIATNLIYDGKIDLMHHSGIEFFQTTDIETKFYMRRKLAYDYPSFDIELKDLLFLSSEVEAVEQEIHLTNPTLVTVDPPNAGNSGGFKKEVNTKSDKKP